MINKLSIHVAKCEDCIGYWIWIHNDDTSLNPNSDMVHSGHSLENESLQDTINRILAETIEKLGGI